jgi:hypothetical protein
LTRPWAIANVADLPCPHFLWKCRWADEHSAAIASETHDRDGHQRAFERFAERLSAEHVSECPYHRSDWHLAAETACQVVTEGDPDNDEAWEAARRAGADECTAAAAETFFGEPVHVNGDQVGGGQHRVCAMKLTGVGRCPITL